MPSWNDHDRPPTISRPHTSQRATIALMLLLCVIAGYGAYAVIGPGRATRQPNARYVHSAPRWTVIRELPQCVSRAGETVRYWPEEVCNER